MVGPLVFRGLFLKRTYAILRAYQSLKLGHPVSEESIRLLTYFENLNEADLSFTSKLPHLSETTVSENLSVSFSRVALKYPFLKFT